MEIFLIRHTELKADNGICYGHTDLPLADNFAERVGEIKIKIAPHQPFDQIYTSPSKRCLMLAEEIQQGLTPIVDEQLKELNFGDWEMKRWDEIDPAELNAWMDDFLNVCCPKGESYQQLFARSKKCFERITAGSGKKVLIVAHAGVIRAILSFVLHIPLRNSFALQIDCGKISKIKILQKDNIIVPFVNH